MNWWFSCWKNQFLFLSVNLIQLLFKVHRPVFCLLNFLLKLINLGNFILISFFELFQLSNERYVISDEFFSILLKLWNFFLKSRDKLWISFRISLISSLDYILKRLDLDALQLDISVLFSNLSLILNDLLHQQFAFVVGFIEFTKLLFSAFSEYPYLISCLVELVLQLLA